MASPAQQPTNEELLDKIEQFRTAPKSLDKRDEIEKTRLESGVDFRVLEPDLNTVGVLLL